MLLARKECAIRASAEAAVLRMMGDICGNCIVAIDLELPYTCI